MPLTCGIHVLLGDLMRREIGQRLRARRPDTPHRVITSQENISLARHAVALGVDNRVVHVAAVALTDTPTATLRPVMSCAPSSSVVRHPSQCGCPSSCHSRARPNTETA